MAALFDTSVVIDLERLDLGAHGAGEVVVSAVTVAELAFGLGVQDEPERLLRTARFQRTLAVFEILPFGVEEAKMYGVLADLVSAVGRNPRARRLDLQIAATAAAARLPLLTVNPRDFVGLERLLDVVPITR